MTNVAIIRCEKNENRCPLTGCLKALVSSQEGFERYDGCSPAGLFTCRCPGDNAIAHAKILKSKGAEAIHFCTCGFAIKTETGWSADNGGFCDQLEQIAQTIARETGLPCILGTAHLPEGYVPRVIKE